MAVGGTHRKDDYGDLDSEFDSSERDRRLTWRDDPLSHQKPISVGQPTHSSGLPSKQVLVDERDKEEWYSRRYHLLSMDAYSRHKTLINHYLLASGKSIEQIQRPTDKDRNDYDVLREEHRFIWDSNKEAETWEQRLAKAYYDKLFKEYTISDLSRYKENKVALRWRTEKEVVEGKGQFICGSKHCSERESLTSWEVNFGYVEHDEKKNALVKVRLCISCSKKLNYHHKKKMWKKGKRKSKHEHKKKTKRSKRENESDSSSVDEEDKGTTSILSNLVLRLRLIIIIIPKVTLPMWYLSLYIHTFCFNCNVLVSVFITLIFNITSSLIH